MSKFKIILVVGDNQATILKLDYSKPSMLIIASMSLFGTDKKLPTPTYNPPPPNLKAILPVNKKITSD